MAELRITQTKSVIGTRKDTRATLQTLGLHRIRQSVVRADTPDTRGLVRAVRHLVSVEEVK